MIWEPFVLALVLGLIVSAGLYYAYMWPEVDLLDERAPVEALPAPAVTVPSVAPTTEADTKPLRGLSKVAVESRDEDPVDREAVGKAAPRSSPSAETKPLRGLAKVEPVAKVEAGSDKIQVAPLDADTESTKPATPVDIKAAEESTEKKPVIKTSESADKVAGETDLKKASDKAADESTDKKPVIAAKAADKADEETTNRKAITVTPDPDTKTEKAHDDKADEPTKTDIVDISKLDKGEA